eukprot:scaffold375401_cov41-Prasinocladus_malaysianus.AAC.1
MGVRSKRSHAPRTSSSCVRSLGPRVEIRNDLEGKQRSMLGREQGRELVGRQDILQVRLKISPLAKVALHAVAEGCCPALKHLPVLKGLVRIVLGPPGGGLTVDVSDAVDAQTPKGPRLSPAAVPGVSPKCQKKSNDGRSEGKRSERGHGDERSRSGIGGADSRRDGGDDQNRPSQLGEDAAVLEHFDVPNVAVGPLMSPPVVHTVRLKKAVQL